MDKNKVVEGEQRSEPRDPGEQEQNRAIAAGLADVPVVETVADGKCPSCGRDKVQS